MHKRILDADNLKTVAETAISLIAAPVKRTLGPRGNPIIIERSGQNPDGTPIDPLITKDGVTVCENTSFRNPALNTIAKTIIQVAKKTVNQGGDGTTTSVVLAEAIYKEGVRFVEKGENSIELYKDLQEIKDAVIEYIDDIKIPIKTNDQIKNVAMISSNGDEEVSDKVVEAVSAAGEHGYIQVEEGTQKETTLEVIDGASYKTGWRAFGANGNLFVNDAATNRCELTDAAVLLYAGKLDSVHELTDFINKLMKFDATQGYLKDIVNLLIVAYDYSDDVKNFILKQNAQAKLPIAAIKAPADGSPNHRTAMLHDLASLLGGSVASKGILELESLEDSHLGFAEKIEISPEDTLFFNGGGDPDDIKNRLKELDTLLETANLDPWDQQNVRIRKGKLSQGIVILRVGGITESEIGEKKDRAEDALCAAKAAIKDGVVAGGGITLYQFAEMLEGKTVASKIMKAALKAPMKQIIENSGKSYEQIFTELIYKQSKKTKSVLGYDARNDQFVDMVEAGILDPAIVTKSALENATSIAGLLLTTGGALVSDVTPKDGESNPLAAMFGA